jgi:TIR domain
VKVFISYSGSDEKWADRLRSALAKYEVDVWDPASQIAPGDNWGLKYGKALENSDAVVVLISPASVKSDWVRHEIQYALSSAQFRDRLIPVLVRPTDEIPWILRKLKVIRASHSVDETARRIVNALRKAPVAAIK